MGTNSIGETPIACTLQPEAVPDRVGEWWAILAHVRARTAAPDGALRVEFDDDIDLAEVSRLVVAEQRCCAFFSFAVTVDRRGIALEVRAPDGATELVTSLFGAPT